MFKHTTQYAQRLYDRKVAQPRRQRARKHALKRVGAMVIKGATWSMVALITMFVVINLT